MKSFKKRKRRASVAIFTELELAVFERSKLQKQFKKNLLNYVGLFSANKQLFFELSKFGTPGKFPERKDVNGIK